MSIHINAKKTEISTKVLMPGDPLRAKYIAETYLTDVKKINNLRNMFGYTGKYKNHLITIFASGMGMPSMGIYAYELYKDYEVDTIIRIGSCGSYLENIKLKDIILVDKAITNSNYAYSQSGKRNSKLNSSALINEIIAKKAYAKMIDFIKGNIHCTDAFYGKVNINKLIKKYHCLGVEMESFALFHMAKIFNKNAACLLTVSDSLVTNEALSGEEREKTFNQMIELALETIISL